MSQSFQNLSLFFWYLSFEQVHNLQTQIKFLLKTYIRYHLFFQPPNRRKITLAPSFLQHLTPTKEISSPSKSNNDSADDTKSQDSPRKDPATSNWIFYCCLIIDRSCSLVGGGVANSNKYLNINVSQFSDPWLLLSYV